MGSWSQEVGAEWSMEDVGLPERRRVRAYGVPWVKLMEAKIGWMNPVGIAKYVVDRMGKTDFNKSDLHPIRIWRAPYQDVVLVMFYHPSFTPIGDFDVIEATAIVWVDEESDSTPGKLKRSSYDEGQEQQKQQKQPVTVEYLGFWAQSAWDKKNEVERIEKYARLYSNRPPESVIGKLGGVKEVIGGPMGGLSREADRLDRHNFGIPYGYAMVTNFDMRKFRVKGTFGITSSGAQYALTIFTIGVKCDVCRETIGVNGIESAAYNVSAGLKDRRTFHLACLPS